MINNLDGFMEYRATSGKALLSDLFPSTACVLFSYDEFSFLQSLTKHGIVHKWTIPLKKM